LNQLNIGPNRHKITKLAVVLAMDRHNPQRELISRLISDLYSGLLTQNDIARGFDELLVSLDDLQLDTPDAHTVRKLIMFTFSLVVTVIAQYIQHGNTVFTRFIGLFVRDQDFSESRSPIFMKLAASFLKIFTITWLQFQHCLPTLAFGQILAYLKYFFLLSY